MASRVLTQMYIVMRTTDANPISGPMSYLLTLIQDIHRKAAPQVALTGKPGGWSKSG
jgi:hypothetical protein